VAGSGCRRPSGVVEAIHAATRSFSMKGTTAFESPGLTSSAPRYGGEDAAARASGAHENRSGLHVLLVCSSGGHLQQMLALQPAWGGFQHTWVSLWAPDAEHLLANEAVIWGSGPTNRSISKFLRNLSLAWRTVRRVDPDVVLSTGAALAVPFLLVARLQRRRAVYVESFTRTDRLSLSGRLVYPLVHRFFVQWPHTAQDRRKALYEGSVL
jgi:beta-1,4-N-acetylglucosaminyltransferase